MSKCKGCGKEIKFAIGPTGKTIPLDIVAPVYKLSYQVVPSATNRSDVSVAIAERAAGYFVSHFVTCPQASRFSKSKKERT